MRTEKEIKEEMIGSFSISGGETIIIELLLDIRGLLKKA